MTNLDPRLLEILACPCQYHAAVKQVADEIVCRRCRTAFPITDGIPVMLLDQATPGPSGVGADLGGE